VRPAALALAAAVTAAAVLSACSTGAANAPVASPPVHIGPQVYAAIGASESVGVGTDDPPRQSFPERLFQILGPGSVLYNFGIPSETVQKALTDELPPALAVHPTLATVWFNVDDLIASVPVADYEARLDQLVGALRHAGVRVLVANTPQLEHLPAYNACRPNPPPSSIKCPLPSANLPPPDQVEAEVQAYNAAVAAVASREGATLVDLNTAGDVPDQHPGYVSRDGFHPSAEGAQAIADQFAQALGIPLPSPTA
jgi:lysophospholipase L1-like esterase